LSATDLVESSVDQSAVGKRMSVRGCAVGMHMESCAAGCSVRRWLAALVPSQKLDAVAESLAAELESSLIALCHCP